MIRAFAARIALLNALLAVSLFAIIGVIAAFVTYASLQNAMSQNLAQAERDVPVVTSYYRLTTLEEAAPRIVAELSRPGVRVLVHDIAAHRSFDGSHENGFEDHDPGERHGNAPSGGIAARDGPGGFDDGGGPGAPGGTGDAGRILFGAPSGFGPGGPHSDHAHLSPSSQALLAFLHVEPVRVAVRGGYVVLFPDPSSLGYSWPIFAGAIAVAGVLAALAAWGIGGYASRQTLRPLREVTAELERFGAGDFTPRNVAALDRGEFSGLAQAYNRAAAQVARAFEERTAAERDMRQFIADAAHELRTPLTIVTGYVELLRGGAGGASSEKIFATIGAESDRMRDCIAKLLALARLDSVESVKEPVDLSALVADVAATFAAVKGAGRILVDVAPGLHVLGSAAELHEAFANLVDNAVKYGGDAAVRLTAKRDGEAAIVAVEDDGPGMTEIEAASAFARFYRGDARGEREGSGLGLAIVARIVERAGGTVALRTAPGEGACFTVRLTTID